MNTWMFSRNREDLEEGIAFPEPSETSFYPPRNVPLKYCDWIWDADIIDKIRTGRDRERRGTIECQWFRLAPAEDRFGEDNLVIRSEAELKVALERKSFFRGSLLYLYVGRLPILQSDTDVSLDMFTSEKASVVVAQSLQRISRKLQLMPESRQLLVSVSSLENFYTTACALQIGNITVEPKAGNFLSPGFQICYLLFFNTSYSLDGSGSRIEKATFCNRFSRNRTQGDGGPSWLIVSESNSFQEFLRRDILGLKLEDEGYSVTDTYILHLSFCALAIRGWRLHIDALYLRFFEVEKLARYSDDYEVRRLSDLRLMEQDTSNTTELLRSNSDALKLVSQFFDSMISPKLKLGGSTYGGQRDIHGHITEELESLRRILSGYLTEIKFLGNSIQRLRVNLIEERSYTTNANHLKISFLSQNFMRGLGFTMMIFLPGIFTSTLFSSQFFYYTESGVISPSRGIWVWFVIVIPLSCLTILLLILSLHKQLGQSLWEVITEYFPWYRSLPLKSSIERRKQWRDGEGIREEERGEREKDQTWEASRKPTVKLGQASKAREMSKKDSPIMASGARGSMELHGMV